jgi:outer membrane protein
VQIAAAEEGIRVARSGYYPRVNLFASLGSSYSSLSRRPVDGSSIDIPVTTASGDPILVGDQPFTLSTSPIFESTPFGDQFWGDNRAGSVGISISVPVFDRFLTRSQVRQARLAADNERILREDLQQEIAVQVRQAYLDYRNVEKRLDVTARQLAAADAALAAEEDRYELGVSTLVELTQARARRVEAASARAQAVAQYIFQRRLLEYQAGLLDPTVDLFD